MIRLYEAVDSMEAQMLKDELASSGVASVILHGELTGAMGELPANIYPEVWLLKDEERPIAEQVLKAFSKRRLAGRGGKPWRCARCGEWVDAEFGVCWNCATPKKRD